MDEESFQEGGAFDLILEGRGATSLPVILGI